MRFLLLLLFILFLLPGCKKSNKVPDGVLPPPKMQQVMQDMMKADQFLSDYVLNKDSTKDKDRESIQLYNRVFTLHNITKEDFAKSFAFYKAHPVQLQALMDSISKQKLAIPSVAADSDTTKKSAAPSFTSPQSRDSIRRSMLNRPEKIKQVLPVN
jgi:Domain of unknown function (DUF4296)